MDFLMPLAVWETDWRLGSSSWNTCRVPESDVLNKKQLSLLKFRKYYVVFFMPLVNVYSFSPLGMLKTRIIVP